MNSLRIKRVISSCIDFVIMLGLFFGIGFIYSCIFIENNSEYQNNVKEINNILLESGLFVDNGENILVEITDNYDEKLDSFYKMTYNDNNCYPYIDSNDHYVSYNENKQL